MHIQVHRQRARRVVSLALSFSLVGVVAVGHAGSLPPGSSTGTVKLADLEALAVAREPGLREGDHRARARTEEARAEGSLPPPVAGVDLWQVPLSKPLAVQDASMLMISLRQEIPAPGSLSASARAADADSSAAGAMRTARERALVRDVDRAYADYVEASGRTAVRHAFVAVSFDVVSASRRRYAGGGSLADVARAELEHARFEAELATDEGAVSTARARLDAFTNRDTATPLGPPELSAPVTVRDSAVEIAARAASDNPDARSADAAHRAALERQHAAETRSSTPSFAVGVAYFHPVSNMPAGWGASAAMSLPWLWGEGRHRAASAKEEALADEAALDAARVAIRRDVAEAWYVAKAAERRLVTLEGSVAPVARQAESAARAAYASPSGPPLVSVLDAERAALDVELESIAARAELDRALAELDFAAGKHLPRVPLAMATGNQNGGTP